MNYFEKYNETRSKGQTKPAPSLFFRLTRGTKAFHYPKEKKIKMIILVAASETIIDQN